MGANIVLLARTALSDQTKLSSLTQEVVRRLLHTSRRLENSYRMDALEKLCQKMTNSGHRPSYIKRVMVAGWTSYSSKLRNSQLEKDHPAYKPLHFGTKFDSFGRWKRKVMARENWFKETQDQVPGSKTARKHKKFQKAGENIKTSTVMFIPSTRNSTLVKALKEAEIEMSKITRFKVRYQEAGGIQLARLFSTDLGKGQPCGREECQPCGRQDEENIPNCKQSSILYESSCQICNKDTNRKEEPSGRLGIYYGETSRSLFERSREHFKDAADFSEGSHMIKHWLTSHVEEETCPDFKFRIVGSYKDCLTRQVSEAVMIHYSKDILLNSKNEYNSNCLTRLTIDENKFEKKTRERLEAIEEAKEKEAWELFKNRKRKEGKRRKKFLEVPEVRNQGGQQWTRSLPPLHWIQGRNQEVGKRRWLMTLESAWKGWKEFA